MIANQSKFIDDIAFESLLINSIPLIANKLYGYLSKSSILLATLSSCCPSECQQLTIAGYILLISHLMVDYNTHLNTNKICPYPVPIQKSRSYCLQFGKGVNLMNTVISQLNFFYANPAYIIILLISHATLPNNKVRFGSFFVAGHLPATPISNILWTLHGISLSDVNSTRDYYSSPAIQSLPALNTAKSYSIQWRATLPAVIQHGLSLNSFQLAGFNKVLSYTIQLQQVTTIGSDVNLQVVGLHSQISFLCFSIILITEVSQNMEIINYSSSFTILNNPVRTESEQTFYPLSSVFASFNTVQTFVVFVMIQWFTLNNLPFQYQHFNAYALLISGTPMVSLTAQSLFAHLNSYNSFKISILILRPYSMNPNIVSFTEWFDNLYFATPYFNFHVPSEFGYPAFDDNCIFNLFYIFFDSVHRGQFYYIFEGKNLTNASYIGTEAAYTYCFLQCLPGTFYGPSGSCTSCQQFLANCLSCTSFSVCTQCKSIAAIAPNTTKCKLCRDLIYNCETCTNSSHCLTCLLGKLVTGGCTTVVGCTSLTEISIPSIQKICSACDQTSYYLDSVTHSCLCKVGHLAGENCIDAAGCISAVQVQNQTVCVYCNTSASFQLNGTTQTCVCVQGFELIQSQCIQICGDGKIFASECDDGNIINGDGCSSSCRIEKYYKCSKVAPSVCQFYGTTLQLSLVYVNKVEDQNKGTFTFAFSPSLLNLEKMNVSKYFHFLSNNVPFEVVNWSYKNGSATVLVNYLADFQTENAAVNFTFDQFYVHHAPITLNFTVKSNGTKLLYFSQTSQKLRYVSYTFLAISILSILLLLISSYFHQMAGVELIHTLQTVYFLHFTIHNYAEAESKYMYLSLVSLSDYFLNRNYLPFRLSQGYQILSFSQNYAEMVLIIAGIIVIASATIVKVIRVISGKLCEAKMECLSKITERISSHILLPLFLALLFPMIIILSSFSVRSPSSSLIHFSQTLKSALILGLLLVLVAPLVDVFRKHRNQGELSFSGHSLLKPQYLLFYQMLSMLYLMLLMLSLQSMLDTCLACLPFWFFVLLLQIYFRPYQQSLDNCSIIINSNAIILFCIYLCLRKYSIISVEGTINMFYDLLITVILVVSVILTAARVIRQIVRKVKYQCKQNRDSEKTNQNHGLIVQPYKFAFEQRLLVESQRRNKNFAVYIEPNLAISQHLQTQVNEASLYNQYKEKYKEKFRDYSEKKKQKMKNTIKDASS